MNGKHRLESEASQKTQETEKACWLPSEANSWRCCKLRTWPDNGWQTYRGFDLHGVLPTLDLIRYTHQFNAANGCSTNTRRKCQREGAIASHVFDFVRYSLHLPV